LGEFQLAISNSNQQERLVIYRSDETTFLIQHISQNIIREKEFDITSSSFVPHWVLANPPRRERNVYLIYSKKPLTYPLVFKDALKLQRLITGYITVASSSNADCKVTYDKHPAFSAILRSKSYRGDGEIQLWWPDSREARSELNSPTDTSIAGSTMASARTRLRSDLVSISQHENGEQVIVGAIPNPVVLVAILKGIDGSYAVIKFNIMGLKMTASAGDTIDFDIVGEHGTVDILQGPTAEDLDLCRMIPTPEVPRRRRDDKLRHVKGTLLSITFRDTQARESFARGLRFLQRKRADVEEALWALPGRVFAELDGNDEETIRGRPPRLPRIETFSELELESIFEMGDNQTIRREMR